jgi:hypothetical protein
MEPSCGSSVFISWYYNETSRVGWALPTILRRKHWLVGKSPPYAGEQFLVVVLGLDKATFQSASETGD